MIVKGVRLHLRVHRYSRQMKIDSAQVLTISATPRSRGAVRRHYLEWRKANGCPFRCDNDRCMFHVAALTWNDEDLGLELDHRSGNAADNRPENLCFLCPNCHSQNKETKGGANARRIELLTDGLSYTAKRGGSSSDAYLLAASTGPTSKFGTPSALQTPPRSRPLRRPPPRPDAS